MSDREHDRMTTVRTTGILQNNFATAITAHIDLVNLNNRSVEVRLQVLNWGDAVTQTNPIATLLDVTQVLPGNTRMAFNATVPSTFHYEVRLTVMNHEEAEDVLITTYGRTSTTGGILNGLTVLNSQFTTVHLRTHC